MLGPSYIADFSSRGPTEDGRISPQIVAPGKYILSAGALPEYWGECDEYVPDVMGMSGEQGDIALLFKAGTSMATPVVSGTAALVRQYFEEEYYPVGRKKAGIYIKPSGALVKAVLLNGAQTDIKGVDNGSGGVTPTTAYDNTIGFGRVNLATSLYIEGFSSVQAQVWDRETLQDVVQEVKKYSVDIDRSKGCQHKDLSVTLVWVEEAATPGCTLCVLNDIDLEVTRNSDSTVHYPNGRTGPDRVNNAERVVIQDVADKEDFTIQVRAHNLNVATQQFALVATGCFGGVPNTLDMQASVFAADEPTPPQNRTTLLIIISCSVLGGLLLVGLGFYFFAKKRV